MEVVLRARAEEAYVQRAGVDEYNRGMEASDSKPCASCGHYKEGHFVADPESGSQTCCVIPRCKCVEYVEYVEYVAPQTYEYYVGRWRITERRDGCVFKTEYIDDKWVDGNAEGKRPQRDPQDPDVIYAPPQHDSPTNRMNIRRKR